MIPDDEPTGQPLNSVEIIDDDVVNKKTTKKKATTFDIPNTIPPSTENGSTSEGNKNKEKRSVTDTITMKDPELSAEKNNIMTQRTIEVATATVIVNIRITTPVTIQLKPSKGSTNLNVLKTYHNISSAMKIIDLTLKIITFQNKTIDISDQFPSSAL